MRTTLEERCSPRPVRPRYAAGRLAAALLVLVAIGSIGARALAADDPPADETQRRISELIGQLGSGEYIVRQRAEQELVGYGFEALDAILAAQKSADLEVAARAAYVSALINIHWERDGDPEEVRRLLSDYGLLDENGKRARIVELAMLGDDGGLTALVRIVRYEKSDPLGKEAALAIIRPERQGRPPLTEQQTAARGETLRSLLQSEFSNNQRTAAAWVRAYVAGFTEPQEAIDQLAVAIEREKSALREEPGESNVRHVLVLAEMQVANLRRLGRDDETSTVFADLVQFGPRDIESIRSLLSWLIEQEAWEAIDTLVTENEMTVLRDPRLLYQLAQECRNRGAYDRAEHFFVRVLDMNQTGDLSWIFAGWYGSQMLHDIGKHQAAADMLKRVVGPGVNEADVRNQAASIGVQVEYLRALVEYYQACAGEEQGDVAKQRAHLDLAIAHDPTDLDTLIAMYRLGDGDAEYRRQVIGRIERHAKELQTEIAANPGDPSPYNQFAWLIGNTQGDFAEAIQFSQKSLELRPDTAAYLDTLAHCYAAIGDFANAVKFQTRAVELEPQTQIIVRKLDVFKAKLTEQENPSTP
jgi:tetratricopeptide (TPR) repeat protein